MLGIVVLLEGDFFFLQIVARKGLEELVAENARARVGLGIRTTVDAARIAHALGCDATPPRSSGFHLQI